MLSQSVSSHIWPQLVQARVTKANQPLRWDFTFQDKYWPLYLFSHQTDATSWIHQKVSVLEEAVRRQGGGRLCSYKSDTLCNPVKYRDRDRKRALIRGLLWDDLECCYTSKAHIIGIDCKVLEQMSYLCESFFSPLNVDVSYQHLNCPNTQSSDLCQKLELQPKQGLEPHRSGVAAFIHATSDTVVDSGFSLMEKVLNAVGFFLYQLFWIQNSYMLKAKWFLQRIQVWARMVVKTRLPSPLLYICVYQFQLVWWFQLFLDQSINIKWQWHIFVFADRSHKRCPFVFFTY